MWFKELDGIGDTGTEPGSQQQKVKTTNGQICTTALQRLQKKKASRNWLLNSVLVGEIEKHHEERYRALLNKR